MEIRIVMSSIGFGIKKTGFGVNGITGAYIQTRTANSVVTTYGVTDSLSLGSESSTLFVGHVSTEWFKIDSKAATFMSNKANLIGKKVGLEASGSVLFSGDTDIKFTVYDNLGSGNTIFELIDIPTRGGQLSSTKIRGVLKALPAKQPLPATP